MEGCEGLGSMILEPAKSQVPPQLGVVCASRGWAPLVCRQGACAGHTMNASGQQLLLAGAILSHCPSVSPLVCQKILLVVRNAICYREKKQL